MKVFGSLYCRVLLYYYAGSNYIFPNKRGQFSWFVPSVSILLTVKLLQFERGVVMLNRCNKENRTEKTVPTHAAALT